MSRYLLSKAAANDLEVIWDYIAQDDEQAASRWIARLLEACEMLAKSPGIGHHRQDLTPLLFCSGPLELISSPIVVKRNPLKSSL
jgi:toxin ParE1/3/4